MEHHLSIFRPYERDAKHEDQLTRAALIVLKLVPLAHAAFLDLAKCYPLSALPRPRFAMQTEKLVPLDPDAEDPELAELVSVFLGPHENLVETQEPNLASERRARYDGVIEYGSRLLVVIESKLYANASDQQSLDINTKGIAPKKKRRVPVRWQELLDRWWNLVELGVLGPAEKEVMNDFFNNAEENFGDLLPYTDLERCGDNRGRRLRRLRTILEKATGFSAEVRDVLGHAGVKFPASQVVAFDRVSLYIEGDNLIVSVWPAELAPQYKRVYSDPERAEALIALTENPAWQVNANLYLAYWRASGPQRWYPARHVPGPAYVRQWVKDFHDHRAGRRPREDVNDPEFRHWLVEHKYAIQAEMESLDEWANKLPMDHFDIRPSIQVTRSWQLADAVARDSTGQLTAEVHDAINEVLAALDEPRLEDIQS
ncbi:hypothetical protein [Mycobacterium gallinarum]|uniref:hypothetical protein n=1 Tax=Mycobacterium gallinarum TaxID=39689 RepID=UPI0013D36664|nr:hypothetical protein [Mycobacterium gallinarum]